MSKGMIEGFAGATGAIAAALVTYPLSTLSTFEAVRPRVAEEGEERGVERVRPPLFSLDTVLDALYDFEDEGGWERFYDGLKPVLIGSAASQGVYFYFYSAFKRMITQKNQGLMSTKETMGVAYLAGFIDVLVTNPIWVLATRMQWRRQDHETMWSTFLNAKANNGNQWIIKGLVPALMMASSSAVQYAIYEILTGVRKRTSKKQSLSSIDIFVSSAISQLLATFATYPLFSVKARLQARESLSTHGYLNFADALMKIFKEEGLVGFYNGLSVKSIQSTLCSAIMMTIKERITETLMSRFDKRRNEHDA